MEVELADVPSRTTSREILFDEIEGEVPVIVEKSGWWSWLKDPSRKKSLLIIASLLVLVVVVGGCITLFSGVILHDDVLEPESQAVPLTNDARFISVTRGGVAGDSQLVCIKYYCTERC